MPVFHTVCLLYSGMFCRSTPMNSQIPCTMCSEFAANVFSTAGPRRVLDIRAGQHDASTGMTAQGRGKRRTVRKRRRLFTLSNPYPRHDHPGDPVFKGRVSGISSIWRASAGDSSAQAKRFRPVTASIIVRRKPSGAQLPLNASVRGGCFINSVLDEQQCFLRVAAYKVD